ncbi:MAG: gliding motility-associated C-terminal domain-containing protein, partial [Niastella sp.]|uniref:Ig-like domain-containing protein n=1 Tax=Niastella sp. TaxID=1869183 RepID=UPI00389A86DD
QNTTATALTATGSNLLWYTVATNGTGVSTAPVPSTASAGTTTWYVTQTPAGSCESARTPITVTVGSPATAPTASSPTYCQNTTATALTATGSNLLWYTVATNGTGVSTAPVPSTASAGTTNWYVTQTPAGSCESARTPITVTINSQPAAPTVTSPTYCQNDAAVVLTASGSNLLWYTTAVGGTGDAVAPTPSTATAGTITYYVSQSSGCESAREIVTVTVNAPPPVSISPVTGPLCAGSSVTLNATGAATYQWSPATGLSDAVSNSPVAALKTDVLYTVTGTDNNGCTATAQISLKPAISCLGYNIPDAFTPNGDGHNDLFRVVTADVPRSFHMTIFNRYGGKVFETSDILAGWNGTMGGSPPMSGAYVYTIVIKTSAGTTIEKKGTVLVIR